MAKVSDWSSIEEENLSLDQLSLSNEQGQYWNKIMAALRRKCDDLEGEIQTVRGGYNYKGSVAALEDLPVSGNEVGDVWSVESIAGENFAWTGDSWHSLGVFTANLVHLDGDETIGGTKTFSEAIVGSVTGHAGSVEAFAEAQDVTLTGDVTGTASSTAGWTVSTTLASSGVTAGTYGPDSDKTPAAESSFVVPCFTVDAKGRVTAVVERTITLPPDSDTTYSAFQGATSLADGAAGLVPKPLAADVDKVLGAGGAWRLLTAADIASGTLDLARIPTLDTSRIPSLDASKITSGTISVDRLPAGALERLVVVANQAARFALTDMDVQVGDTVKESDTGLMFFVVDTEALDTGAGYEQYTVGSATSVPWSGVTGKPSVFPPESHTHGSLTNDGKLSTASRVVVTDGNKGVDVSSVTATELGYLSGATSNVQTQLNTKAADNGVVHLSGTESITGQKTLTSSLFLKCNNIEYNVFPNETRYKGIQIQDKNGQIISSLLYQKGTGSVPFTQASIFVYRHGSTSDTAGIIVGFDASGNAVSRAPSTSSTRTNGEDIVTRDWIPKDTRIVHTSGNETIAGTKTFSSKISGSVSGTAANVTGVVAIANGGTGSSSKNFVDLSNAQTVAGIKTFSNDIKASIIQRGVDNSGLILYGGTTKTSSSAVFYGKSHAALPGCFSLRATKTTEAAMIELRGEPGGTLRWNGQTIQTSSDERLKTPLMSVPDAVLDAWGAVGWGQFRFLASVSEKGEQARLHLGLIAQRVHAVFEERGLDACSYGILCHETDSEHDLWMVRYTEALAMEAAYQRRRAARLEARVAALEERLNGN